MKTITIELDNDLERELEKYSGALGQGISAVAVKILSQGLSERNRRATAIQALDEVFSRSVPSPFDAMSEETVMKLVNEEIRSAREAH